VNFFQPSFKLAAKARDGARIRKFYHPPATPCQRLLADPRTPAAVRQRVQAWQATLDPVQLLSQMRAAQQRLVDIADSRSPAMVAAAPPLEQFLSNLRTAWKEGEVRPTARAKPKAKRLRRRPDPFATVSEQLRAWFDAEPKQTGRALFSRLQSAYPDVYPAGQLRTLQRRLKAWRQETAQQMVFPITPGLAITEPTLGSPPGEVAEMRAKNGFLRHLEASRPEGSHLRPLSERCMNLSTHTAPIRQTHPTCRSASVQREARDPSPTALCSGRRGFCCAQSA
jgi:hypothetical protein